MVTHIGILPSGVIQTLSAHLNRESRSATEEKGLRFLRLPHPRTCLPTLFLPQPTQDPAVTLILEVQIVSPTASRSWFMEGDEVVADGKLLFMSPVDPTFLLIPILQAILPTDNSVGNFRTLEDIFEQACVQLASAPTQTETKDPSQSIPENDLLYLSEMTCIKQAMRRICDYKDIASDMTVYRFSRTKCIEYLMKKVARLSTSAIVEKCRTLTRELAKDGLLETGKEPLLELGRLKGACDLVAQYVPTELQSELLTRYDFKSLDAHLKSIQDEAMSSVTMDANPGVAKVKEGQSEQKRKASAQNSKGVEKLKRANINGMAKLSNFFKKPEPSKT